MIVWHAVSETSGVVEGLDNVIDVVTAFSMPVVGAALPAMDWSLEGSEHGTVI